jgi:two-component system LytT family response regulator
MSDVPRNISAVIIDDMHDFIDLLSMDLATYCPEVTIIGTAHSVVAGAKLLKSLRPDVLFLDIELTDGTGFDLLEILPDIPFKIIFTTASDKHAIKAFRFSAIDYLLKPINPEELQAAVSRITKDNKAKVELLLNHWDQERDVNNIALHTSEKIRIISIDDIIRCAADNNYTIFYLTDGSKEMVSKTLKYFDIILQPKGFSRVHQSHLIQLNKIKSFVKTEGGYLIMEDGSRVSVSVRKRKKLFEALENMGL